MGVGEDALQTMQRFVMRVVTRFALSALLLVFVGLAISIHANAHSPSAVMPGDLRGQALYWCCRDGITVEFLRIEREHGHIMVSPTCDLTELLKASRDYLPLDFRWSGHQWSKIPDADWGLYNETWHRWRTAVERCR